MIEDKDLEELMKEKNEIAPTNNQIVQPKFEKTGFAEKMEDVKLNVLQDAENNDEQFVDTIKQNLKKAAVTATEVENKKQELEKAQVETEQKKEERSQTQVEHGKQEDIWTNKEKRRQYHYDGVRPIMEFVGIKSPMNLLCLYFLTFVLIWFFILAKLCSATIGTLLCGAIDQNRSKAAKGFCWTMLGLSIVALLASVIYLFLKWQKII